MDDKCFKNPFDPIDIPKFGLEDYKEWEEDYVKDGAPSDISKLEGFKSLFQNHASFIELRLRIS